MENTDPNAIAPLSDLLDSIRKGECVLFVGHGLNATAGLPSRQQLLSGLISHSFLDPRRVVSLQEDLAAGELEIVAESLATDLPGQGQMLASFLQSIYPKHPPLAEHHRLLASVPFSELLTITYDSVLATVFPAVAQSGTYTPQDANLLLDAKTQRRPFLLNLYGTPERPESLIFSSIQFRDILDSNLPFNNFIQGLFFSRNFLFIGMTAGEIQDFLQCFPYHESSASRHFALVQEAGRSVRTRLNLLERKFGLSIIGVDSSDDAPLLRTFLQVLSGLTAVPEHLPAPAHATPVAPAIRRLILEDIGVFERLELDFSHDRKWKVLLGDNGVGKSTILKAIAVAVIGSDARPYAGRLVRAGKTRGRITLFTDRNPHGYVTEIMTKDMLSDAEILSRPSRFLEAEGALVLGFSPLRIATWSASAGPQEMLQKGRPTSDDLVPLLSGEVDPRMDRLKQWIVNLDSADKPRQITSFTGHERRVTGLIFSPDGRSLISSSIDGTFRVWDSWTGKETRQVTAHTKGGINAISLSADGEILVTGSFDKTANLMNLAKAEMQECLKGHNSQVLAAAISPDARFVATGTEWGSVRIWTAPFHTLPRHISSQESNTVWSLAIGGDPPTVFAGTNGGEIRRFSMDGTGLPSPWTGDSAVWSLAVDPAGSKLVAGLENGSVILCNLSSCEAKALRQRGSRAFSVAISRDARYAASGTKDGRLRVWELDSERVVLSVKAHTAEVWAVALSPDGHSVVSGADDGSLKLWSIPSDESTSKSLALIRQFFAVIAELTDRRDIDFIRVSENFRVMVRTADVPDGIPLEVLSQGLTSLLSWVGVLCQRMKETALQSETTVLPIDGHAIVLIDEIDAHMHPRWQQWLVYRLKKLFPNVQFIACTHSPLIVSGLEKAEVERFQIDDGKVQRMDFAADMTMGRTDQILAGELFSLPTTLDPETQDRMNEYKRLLGKSERTDEEERQFFKLNRTLESRVPPSPTSVLPRRARALLQALDHSPFLDASNEPNLNPSLDAAKAEIVERMAALARALRTQSEPEGTAATEVAQ
jgi:WD40 repeat protein